MAFTEMDPVGLTAWTSSPTPDLPHSVVRRAATRGGKLAILRDVSASMDGERSAWASMVITQLLIMCRARGLACAKWWV